MITSTEYSKNIDIAIDELIQHEQFQFTDGQKENLLLPIMKAQMHSHAALSPYVKSWFSKLNLDIDGIQRLTDIPVLPTQMFKHFDLRTFDGKLQRMLYSSSTTGQTPSQIAICPTTARRQTKALASIIKNHFPGKRRPYLVLDSKASNQESEGITARGAAIRGFSIIAKEVVYAFDQMEGRLRINVDRLNDFFERNAGKPVFAIGFTYIIWSELRKQLEEHNVKYNCPDIHIVHGGGWKKLTHQKVDKTEFNSTVGGIFGTEPKNVVDFYGMVEQTGNVFLDCEEGYKHVPNFAEVIIRSPYSLRSLGENEPGLIEVMSVLPQSYPGMSILTEDIGEIVGTDNCACGRRGKYFVFRSRVQRAESRGCGDTFRESS